MSGQHLTSDQKNICLIKMPRRLPVQLTLPKHAGWGGRREGAGRKPKGDRALVTHAARPALAARFPVHVTLRVLPHVWNLRSRRSFRVLGRALSRGGDRFGMRICEFSIQGNHLHLIAEAGDARALSRGMQGLSIRIAKGLNRLMKRPGKVLADRFHQRILRTPTEVRRVVHYVRNNRLIHRARWGHTAHTQRDPYASDVGRDDILLPEAHTYLLLRAQVGADPPS
jgi:REP-associated tyrosine transposase